MTASSSYNNLHAPFLGRLHRAKRGRYVGAWCARHNNHNQWLQVDLGRTMKITGIATQGRQDADQWVTAYWVLYSLDGFHFAQVKEWWSALKVNVSVVSCFSFYSCSCSFTLLFFILYFYAIARAAASTHVHVRNRLSLVDN